MSNNLLYLLIGLMNLASPDMVQGQNYQVAVTITGFQNNKGKVMLVLFSSEDGYPQDQNKAFRSANGAIINNICTIALSGIPKGTYAIACFHDENDNGKLDKNILGIPNEGVGASNNAKGSFGPPKFRDAKFKVENDMHLSISITH